MRKGVLGALGVLLAGAGLAAAQSTPSQGSPGMGTYQGSNMSSPAYGGSVSSGAGYGGQTAPGTYNSGSMGSAVYGNGQRMLSGGYNPGSGDVSQGGYSQGGNFQSNQQSYGYPQQGYTNQGGGYVQQGQGGYGQQGYGQQGYGPQGYGGSGDGPPVNGQGQGPSMGGYGPPQGPPNGYNDGQQKGWNRQDDPSETGRFWVRTEYLFWWLKQQNLPALATTGSATDPFPGALGQPGTAVLFGDSKLDDEGRSGGRISAGFWFDCQHCFGIDGSFFILGSRNTDFATSVDGSPNSLVLARPFFNVIGIPGPAGFSGPVPGAEILAFPGVSSGSVAVSTASRFHGGDANFLVNCIEDARYRLDIFFGFNAARLQEDIDISSTTQINPALPPDQFGGQITNRTDSFDTKTNFYGGQIGTTFEYRYKALVMDITSKTALGVSNETLDINGNTTVRPFGQPAVILPAGLLATETNIGHYTKDRFAALSELDLTLGWQIKRWCRIYGGYSFLYWTSVLRPADQIDQGVNRFFVPPFAPGTALVGPLRPAALFQDTNFWAHGITGGVEFRY